MRENINWHASRRGIFIPPLCRSGTFDLEFIWPAFHIITQSNLSFLPRTNMTTLFKSSEQRSAFSALITVFAVLVIGAIAKSEGAAHVAQMIDCAAHLVK